MTAATRSKAYSREGSVSSQLTPAAAARGTAHDSLWRPRDLPSHTCAPPDANALQLFKNKKSKVVTRYIWVCVPKTGPTQGSGKA